MKFDDNARCGRDGMVDIPDLKSVGPCARVGSTPTVRTNKLDKTYQGRLTFEDPQTCLRVIHSYQMGGDLDPNDLDPHAMGDDRPVLPWPGM